MEAIMTVKKLIMATAVLGLFFMNACMDVTTEVSVNKDGTGKVTYTVLYTKVFVDMMEQMAAMGQQPADGENKEKKSFLEKSADKEEMTKQAENMGNDVTFESVKIIDGPDESKGYEAVFSFKNIEKLALSEMPKKMDGGQSQPSKNPGDKPIKFKLAKKGENSSLTIIMPENAADKKSNEKKGKSVKSENPSQKAKNEEMTKQMRQLFTGFRVVLRVKIDGAVSKTNATYFDKENNKITLVEMDIGKMVENDELMKKLQDVKPEDGSAVIKEKLKGVPFIKFETEKKVTVLFK
jgi:hypothetical protein